MNIQKKHLLLGLFISFLVISGCSLGGGDTTPKITADEKTRLIESTEYEFTIRIPREWDVIETKDFTEKVPPETVVVFRNNIKNEDFTANVNIVRHTLQTPKETLEYAKEVINRQKNGLINYKETGRDLIQIQIGDKKVDTYLMRFEGKKDAGSDLVRFIQIYGVKGTSAYIVLGTISPKENANNVKTVEDIVKSFTLK